LTIETRTVHMWSQSVIDRAQITHA